jgi:hypothetical protein
LSLKTALQLMLCFSGVRVTRTLALYVCFVDRFCTFSQTTQWPKEKVQKDKQRSTKHYTEK